MENSNPEQIVQIFIGKINIQDVDGLFNLMSEDHVFVDSSGKKVKGRHKMKEAWAAYFRMFPDYSIAVEWVTRSDNLIGLFGTAQGTNTSQGEGLPENFWKIPAAWLAVIEKGKIKEWRTYADLEPVRQIMKDSIEKGSSAHLHSTTATQKNI